MKQNESQEDEGFVPTKLQIKAQGISKQNSNDKYNRPIDFQTRYILGDGIIRKQPIQMYSRFKKYLQFNDKSIKCKDKQTQDIKNKKKQYHPIQIKQQYNKPNKLKVKCGSQSKFLQDNDDDDNQQQTIAKSSNNKINSLSENKVYVGQKYINNQNYSLVYSRYKDRIQTISPQDDDFSANQINLSKVLAEYDIDHYSTLRKFQYPPSLIPKYHHNEHQNTREGQIQKSRRKPNKTNLTIHHSQIHHQNHHSRSKVQSCEHSSIIQSNIQNPNLHISIQSLKKPDQLLFDSRFECGNLLYAFKCKNIQNNYILFLHNDTNSYGYNQWFCFSIKNMKSKINYQFTIVNFKKKYSLLKQGMKISAFSLIDAHKNNGNGWSKIGNNIKYQKSNLNQYTSTNLKFYALSFNLEFRHEGDYVCLALNTPYSYTRLIHHMKACSQIVNKKNKTVTNQKNSIIPKKQHVWENRIAGYSISNNAAPFITVQTKQMLLKDEKQQTEEKKQKAQQKKKKAIIILARQHPGQTLSSFMMEQIMYLLAENTQQGVKWLLDNYIFKIFPMINIDGVIYGNFRCDLAGFDLNRNWSNPNRSLHPQIYSIKRQIQKIQTELGIQLVLDLHGHSKQLNSFSYSCKNDPITSRVLSLMISQLNSMFYFPYCTFGLSKYKLTTARGVIYGLTGNQNILTIQNSFFGAKINDKIIVYDPQIIGQISKSILQSIHQYLSKSELRQKCEDKIKNKIDQYINLQKKNQQINRYISGSQSDPFIDQISIKDKIKKILPKSFKTLQQQLQKQEKCRNKKKLRNKKKNSKKVVRTYHQNFKLNQQNHQYFKKKIVTIDKQKQLTKIQDTNKQQQLSTKNINITQPQQQTLVFEYKRPKDQRKKFSFPVTANNLSQLGNKDKISLDCEQYKQNTSSHKNQYMRIVSDFSLPFYVRQKAALVPLKLKSDSLQIVQQGSQISKNIIPTAKGTSINKISITNSFINANQLPLLCILSQQKKRNSLKKNIIIQQHLQKNLASIPPYKSKSYINNDKKQQLKKKTKIKNNNFTYYPQIKPQIQKIKFKNQQIQTHKNANLISKMWRQNFQRYGKDINTFFRQP